MRLKTFQPFFILFVLFAAIVSCHKITPAEQHLSLSIPTSGNSWAVGNLTEYKGFSENKGIENWDNKEVKFQTWFKTEQTGNFDLALFSKSGSGSSTLKITCGDKSKNIQVSNPEWDTIAVGSFQIEKPGYQCIEIEGLEKSGPFFPNIESLFIGGEAVAGKVYFVHDDFYWGRRGPSVHLNFQVPDDAGDIEYFYNEITVPENNDVLGSYFMANGFGQGYFGMQVNSVTERRILFSVWSPFNTDNPAEIPENMKLILLKKGEDVNTGEFGNEGSGGQSFYRFQWKAGITYKFLLRGKPTGTGETDFTAWFFAPEVNQWKLIASWRRPQTSTWLTHLYSFLENFYTETGNLQRSGLFSNQWIRTSKKEWIEISKIKFTADATARKEARMDYSGGVENGSFFLKNCGFFSETTPIDSYFERPANGNKPEINVEELP